MVNWLVLTSVKLLKTAIVAAMALTTPPEKGAGAGAWNVPGLQPRCHGTIILIRHDGRELPREQNTQVDIEVARIVI